jgi:serine/threonine-protein kinase
LDRSTHKRRLQGHPLLGKIIDRRYRVIELIGRGGKGSVFGAQDLRTSSHVAVKVVTDRNAPGALRRLEEEARLIAALRHPNICTLLDVGLHDEVGPYIVMERLFGETLANRIRATGALPVEVGLDLMLQVVSALDAAHAENVIHRDIKPSNIFVTGRAGMPPIAMVLDFGYARRLDVVDSRLTRPGMVVGTPFYLAPEVLRGNDGTRLSDVFACGMLLFEILTGRLPYHGTTVPEFVAAMKRGSRGRLGELCPAAPPALSRLVDRTLSRDPSRRPQSARELHGELRTIVRGLPWFEEASSLPILFEDESSTENGRGR